LYTAAVRCRSILTAGLVVLSCAALLGQTSDPPAARPSFADFLAGIRAEALSRGIRAEILDEALSNIDEPSAIVIERDRTQAETVLPLETYLTRRLTPRVMVTGREMIVRHHDLLEAIGRHYNIPPALIVSIWGFESNYGRFTGVRPTIAALATLAWDPRRSGLFRRELFNALEILNRGDIELVKLRGSWAGAMGQVQFMPSSYLKFAEDFDGDGRRDIWSTPADIFASIANYMTGNGWTEGSWGREVTISDDARRRIANEVGRGIGTCQARRDMTTTLPVERWRAFDVHTLKGQPLPASMPDAALVSGQTRTFLVYRNYGALLEYNCAHSYAIAVGLLADSLAPAEASEAPPPAPPKHAHKSKRKAAH
jgi:membrane-bound lytic murein transglycosylase B